VHAADPDVSDALLQAHLTIALQCAPTVPPLLEAAGGRAEQSAWARLTMLDALLVDALGYKLFDAVFARNARVAFPGLHQALASASKPIHLLSYFANHYLPTHVPGVVAVTEMHGDRVRCTLSRACRSSCGMALLRSLLCALRSLCEEACQDEIDVEVFHGAESLTLDATLPEQFGYSADGTLPRSIEEAREEITRLRCVLRDLSLPVAATVEPSRESDTPSSGHTPCRLQSASARWQLTARQTEVLAQLVLGRSNKEIAADVGCSVATIATHVLAILRKADVHSRQELIAHYWSDCP
jgi:DNA-binding CsgD family transcriptional regulator